MYVALMFKLSEGNMTSQIAFCSKKRALACPLHETFVLPDQAAETDACEPGTGSGVSAVISSLCLF
jgi:hypothetical protein